MVSTDESGHGVVGIGDSFMKGYGLPLAGITCSSWGAWLAWALMTCFTQVAVDNATCEQVLRDQVPLLQSDYRLGVVWLGANDIAHLDPRLFRERLSALCFSAGSRTRTLAVGTLPARLTSPGASQQAHEHARNEVNAAIRQVVAASGAVLVDVEHALDSTWSMSPDGEHPTGLGQLAAAHAAAAALDARGLRFARHLPSVASLRPTASEQLQFATRGRRGLARELGGALVRGRRR